MFTPFYPPSYHTDLFCKPPLHYLRPMAHIKITCPIQNEADADMLMAALDTVPIEGIEQEETQLHIYIPATLWDPQQIPEAFSNRKYTTEIIEAQNWNQTWESNFEPIRIHPHIGIRAHFHPPFHDCLHDIVITPKMSFGTGHHATTSLMMLALYELDCKQKRVLDFGCGTGVLAILAEKLGAQPIIATDNDDWAIDNALENCQTNHCQHIEVSKHTLEELNTPFDIILANINLNILLDNMNQLSRLLNPKGHILFSGILQTDLPALQKSAFEQGLVMLDHRLKDAWALLHATKNNMCLLF